MIKLKSMAALCVSMICAGAFAGAHEDAASKLLDTMNINALTAESINQMLALQIQTQPHLAPYEHTMREFFHTYMSGESLREDYVRLYTDAFTTEELEEMTAFMATPVGQKSLKVSPVLMAKGAAIGQKRVMDNAYILDVMIEEEAKRIQALQAK
ncbi:DUF2059 domain-containing protein [Vibrio sp. WXL103]|uniref:DUF2059 domain-containing protein n=1 Tax=Vibrio sp. WXL103 TaxID=3450710 RepID=UPI003EC6628F